MSTTFLKITSLLFAEGTKEYNEAVQALQEFLKASPETAKSVMQGADNTAEQYYNKNASKTENDYVISTEINADAMGKLLGSEEYISRLALRNEGLVKKLYGYFTTAHDKATSKEARRALKKICDTFGKAIDKSVGGVKLSSIREKEKEELLATKEKYLSLPESERAAWLEENGYTAEDFNDDVLEDNDTSEIVNNERASIKYPTFSQEDISRNMETLADMDAVATIDASKLKKTGKAPKDMFADYFESLGNSIYSDVFGDIALKNSSVKSEIRHGITAEKIASIEAIPAVIEAGEVIFFKVKPKTDVERIVVAAPIKIGIDDYYMGVMLQRDKVNQRLYLHNVVALNTKEETTISSQDDSLTNWSDEDDSRLFITSILQKAINVKAEKQKNAKEPLENSSERANNGENSNMRSSYSKSINQDDVQILRSIGRKSINDFTSEDIKKSQKWAHKFYNELGVKSPFFRAWFGDWRAFETKNKTAVVEEKNTRPYSAGKATNIDTNAVISWGHELKSETINHAVGEKNAISAIGDIELIIENAVLLDTAISMPTSKTKLPNTSFMHSFYTLYKTKKGDFELIKLFVEEALSKDEKIIFKRAYQLKDVKKVTNIPNSVLSKKGGLTEDTSVTTISISDFFEIVKQFDKEFSPKPVNPLLLNDDGTPKEVYHGSNEKFNVFDITKSRSYDETLNYDLPGFYFSESYDESASYGGEVGRYYISINNPYEGNTHQLAKEKGSYRKAYDYLVSQGYDGVIDTELGEGFAEYIVFNPTQIKSATDNIGTFDKENPDVRFSKIKAPTAASVHKHYAEWQKLKVYEKEDVEKMVDTVLINVISDNEIFAEMSGSSRKQAQRLL